MFRTLASITYSRKGGFGVSGEPGAGRPVTFKSDGCSSKLDRQRYRDAVAIMFRTVLKDLSQNSTRLRKTVERDKISTQIRERYQKRHSVTAIT